MTQRCIDRLVARKTGERLSTIRSLGFQLHGPDFDGADDLAVGHDYAVARHDASREQYPDGNPSA
jgi:hypothetical protein